MKLMHTIIKKLWLPAALSVAVLMTGCESTSDDGATMTGDSANVRQSKLRTADGGSSSAYTFTGKARTNVSDGSDSSEPIATDNETLYEDNLVKLEKVYKSGSTVGADFNYDIIVTAKRAITNVEVDEFLPDTIKYKDSTPKAEMNQFGMPSWDLEAFDAGDTETINVTVVPSKVGQYKVCSVVRADPLVCLPLFVGQPELQITKAGPARVELGESATWDIKVTNTGNAIADNVVITDTMPAGFTATSPVSKNVGSLDPGASSNFTVTGKSNKVGQFTNTAVASFTGGDNVTATAPIEVVQSAVGIAKTGPATGYIFVPQPYTITVTNKGNTTLKNLVVTDNLPDGAVLIGQVEQSGEVSDIDSGKTIMNPQFYGQKNIYGYWKPGSDNPLADDSADVVTWKIDSLAPGASKSFKVSFHANKPMTTVNKATVTTESGLTDTASATTVWKAVPGVHTTMMDSIDPIQTGEQTVYTLKTLNQSGYDTFTVTSQVVTIPDGLAIVSASEGGTISGNKVSFLPVNLGPGKEVVRTITVKGTKGGTHTTIMETMTNFRDTPVVDQESTTVY